MVVITSLSVTSYVQARLYNILRKALSHAVSHLDDRILVMRFENMSSFVLLSLSRRACDSRSFRGRRAELFFNNLADLMAAMLCAPVSSDTRKFIA